MSPSTRVRGTPPRKTRRRPPAPPRVHDERPAGLPPIRRVGFIAALRRDRLAMGSLALVALIATTCALAPLLSPYGPNDIALQSERLAPSAAHPLGTDDLGRDQLVRLLYGGRISLSVATLSVILAVLIGTLAGAVAGYAGGFADAAIMRATDAVLAIPTFLIVLFVASLIHPGVLVLSLLIGATQWVETARVVRSVVLSTMQEAHVEAARALGIPTVRILLVHVLPQTLGVILVASTLTFAYALLIESAMSFLGFGVQPPTPSWGVMLQNAQVDLGTSPWLAVFPGLAIFMSVFSFYVLADFLRRRIATPHGF